MSRRGSGDFDGGNDRHGGDRYAGDRHGGDRHGGERHGRGGGGRKEQEGLSLLVRNLSYRTRADDIRRAFSRREGDIRDVYIPKDFRTGEPRGFAFIEFNDPRDCRDAKYEMDRKTIDGREIAVIFAQERRKTPEQMRRIEAPRRDGRRGYDDRDRRRRSRSPRRRYHSRSRSRSPRQSRRKSRSPSRSKSHSRSRSPVAKSRSRSLSKSPKRERSPEKEPTDMVET